MTSVDVVDLAIEAVYRLYHHVLRDETVLDNVLTHCVQKVTERERFSFFLNRLVVYNVPVITTPRVSLVRLDPSHVINRKLFIQHIYRLQDEGVFNVARV